MNDPMFPFPIGSTVMSTVSSAKNVVRSYIWAKPGDSASMVVGRLDDDGEPYPIGFVVPPDEFDSWMMVDGKVEIQVRFIDIYDDIDHVHTEKIYVRPLAEDDDLDEWAFDEIFPHTGDGNASGKHAGYFAEIIDCTEDLGLVGAEFEWGA